MFVYTVVFLGLVSSTCYWYISALVVLSLSVPVVLVSYSYSYSRSRACFTCLSLVYLVAYAYVTPPVHDPSPLIILSFPSLSSAATGTASARSAILPSPVPVVFACQRKYAVDPGIRVHSHYPPRS